MDSSLADTTRHPQYSGCDIAALVPLESAAAQLPESRPSSTAAIGGWLPERRWRPVPAVPHLAAIENLRSHDCAASHLAQYRCSFLFPGAFSQPQNDYPDLELIRK